MFHGPALATDPQRLGSVVTKCYYFLNLDARFAAPALDPRDGPIGASARKGASARAPLARNARADTVRLRFELRKDGEQAAHPVDLGRGSQVPRCYNLLRLKFRMVSIV